MRGTDSPAASAIAGWVGRGSDAHADRISRSRDAASPASTIPAPRTRDPASRIAVSFAATRSCSLRAMRESLARVMWYARP
jgi:hypothetical protein